MALRKRSPTTAGKLNRASTDGANLRLAKPPPQRGVLATSVIKPHSIHRKVLTVANRIDLFDSTYSHFTKQILETIRKETFGQDIGQNSWTTIDEYDRFISWLDLRPEHHVLEVASGSGGPARYLASSVSCRVTGIDANEAGVATANQSVEGSGQADRITFKVADANSRLPFDDNFFDAMLCIDSMNHFPDRPKVFQEMAARASARATRRVH